MAIRPVSGFIDENGTFYETENKWRRNQLWIKISELLTSTRVSMRSNDSTQYHDRVIETHTIIERRHELIELLRQYDELSDE